jgi:hypothetical protein
MVREIWILDTQYSFCMFESSVFFTATHEAESTAPCEDIMDNVMLSFGRSGMVFHGVLLGWHMYRYRVLGESRPSTSMDEDGIPESVMN